MPAIVDPDGPAGQPISVFESGAILQYLGRKFGRFYPSEERARVEVEQWLFWQMGGLGPMTGQYGHFNVYAPEKIPYAIERYTKEAERLLGVDIVGAGDMDDVDPAGDAGGQERGQVRAVGEGRPPEPSFADGLQVQRDHFRLLVQNASDMISILEPDGVVRYESPSHQRVLGRGPRCVRMAAAEQSRVRGGRRCRARHHPGGRGCRPGPWPR